MHVLQSHGDEDQILPFEAAEWLRDLLVEAGCDVEFIPFHGPHTIPPVALLRFIERLSELVR
jgi:phospholipase/carboxylesterase